MRNSLTALIRLAAEQARSLREDNLAPKESSSGPGSDQQYTLADVAEHSEPDDCWMVISDRVYDVTKFLKDHPGGHDVILEHAGRDASLAFHGTGHSRAALQLLEAFCVGELVEHERFNLFSSNSSEPIPILGTSQTVTVSTR